MGRRIRWVLLVLALPLPAVLWTLMAPRSPGHARAEPARASAESHPPPPSVDTGGRSEVEDDGRVHIRGATASARRLRVRVVSTAGPVPEAEVCVEDEAFFVTGSDGVAQVDTAELGVVSIRASKEGYCSVESLIPGGVDEVEIALAPGIPLQGRVVHAGDGAAVPGASVHAAERASGRRLCRVLTTDAQGRFTVPGVAPGTPFVIGVTAPGFGPGATTGMAGPEEVVVVVGEGTTLGGTVHGSGGRPEADVLVRVFPADDSYLERSPDSAHLGQSRLRAAARAKTNADGAYAIEGLGPGTYVVLATGASGAEARATFTAAAPADPVRVDLMLEPTGCILVRVIGPDGEPVPQAGIRIEDDEGGWIYGRNVPGRTDEHGQALVTALKGGAYEVIAQPDRWKAAQARVVVERGPPAVVRINVEPGAILEGTVRDPTGEPVPGLYLFFETRGDSANAPQRKGRMSGHDGCFRFDGLLPLPGLLTAYDWAERWTPWSSESVLPGGPPVAIVVRATACILGRFDPPPASRRVGYTVEVGDSMSGREDLDLDAGGGFIVPGLAEGKNLAVHFDVPGGCLIRCPVAALAAGERREVGVLPVVPGRTLRGHAADENGKPWAFTRIQLIREDYGIDRYTLTDENGRFAFENVDPAAALSLTVWNAESSGQYFEIEDWSSEPVQELVVAR